MSNRDASGHEAETVIAASVRVEGDFVSQGNVLIEGTVEGSLRTERNLRVGEQASISADVFAANASVAGEIKGNVSVSERLELEPTARVVGDIQTKILVVANGASIDGRISMDQQETKQTGAKEESTKSNLIKADKPTKSVEEEKKEAEDTGEKEEKVVSAIFGR